ncbi:hypothetical protein NKH16_02120 [Mesorhizobium sp. M1307]|uniref:hypothetical protein n=1 Tax=Mesorhizobium sp. M1307 TaxID=2957079 RepID=UPI00333AC661
MTVTVKIHVGGNYRATIKRTVDGTEDSVQIGPNEEKPVYFQHGKANTFEITEEYLGETKSA